MATAAEEVVVAVEKEPEAVEPPLAAAPVNMPANNNNALALAKVPEPAAKKSSKTSFDRDVALSKLDDEKKLSYIKAWEENEKSKVENKAQKKHSDVGSWENTKKAALESKLKKIEEQVEKKKAAYAEKTQNKVAMVHKQAEEKRAMVEAKRGEDLLKADEMSAKFRATGQIPKKAFICFGGYT